MSMIGSLSRIPEDVRVGLQKNPEAIFGLLYPEFDKAPVKKTGFFSRLLGRKPEKTTAAPNPLHRLADTDTTDVDKAWHALHFLFTGSDWEGEFPQGFLVSCGEPVGDVDVGYGPARAFTSDQVKAIAEYMTGLDRTELKNRFDPEKMHAMEIYPSIWKDDQILYEAWEYIEGGLEEMTRFVRETAEKDMALLVYLN